MLLTIILTISAIQKTDPPRAVGIGAPVTDFSAARAMPEVREIAARPHPLASQDVARVRGYLVKRLTALGAAPQVQTATVAATNRAGLRTFAIVNNLVARIPGTASTGAVMIVAHYDSVPSGPGAGDDSAAVSAILETIRALKSGAALRNDLIILFTGGEELGMLGAKAFVENYPGLRDVKIVLNFEMRGDYGPVVMFQTSSDNTWLIRALTAAPSLRARSLAPALYKLLPNDTDLTIFLRAGMAGMNFAASGGLPRYHTRLDDVANLDPRSLQHQGSYALALAREFGADDLSKPHTGDAIYFSVFGHFFHYPAQLAMPFAILAAVALLIALIAGVWRGLFTVGGIFAGFGIYAAAIVLALVEGRIVFALFAHFALHEMLPIGTTYGGPLLVAASVAFIVATLCAIYSWLARHLSRANLAAGALVIWAVLALVCSAALPGGSYLLVWPLIFAALMLDVRWLRQSRDSIAPILAALIATIPCAVMIAPTFAPAGDATAMMFLLSAVLAVLMFGIFLPYVDLLSGNREGLLTAGVAVAGVALFAIGIRESRFSNAQPRPDSIFYMLDANSGDAIWASLDPAPDHWTSQFFQSHVRAGSLALLTGELTPPREDTESATRKPEFAAGRFCQLNRGATIEGDAPPAELPAPELNVIDDSTSAGVRTVTMHIASARHAPIVWITIARGVKVLDSSIDGKSPGSGASDGYSAWFWNAPERGFDLTLKIEQTGPVRINVTDQSDSLPSFPPMAISPRPEDVMPAPFLFFDSSTLIRKTFIVGGSPKIPNA